MLPNIGEGFIIIPQKNPPTLLKIFITAIDKSFKPPLYPEEALGIRCLDMIMNNKFLSLNVINYMIKIKNNIKTNKMVKNTNILFATVGAGFDHSSYPVPLIFKNKEDVDKYLNFINRIRVWFHYNFFEEDICKLYEKRSSFLIESFI